MQRNSKTHISFLCEDNGFLSTSNFFFTVSLHVAHFTHGQLNVLNTHLLAVIFCFADLKAGELLVIMKFVSFFVLLFRDLLCSSLL